jgi:hypothetical protein
LRRRVPDRADVKILVRRGDLAERDEIRLGAVDVGGHRHPWPVRDRERLDAVGGGDLDVLEPPLGVERGLDRVRAGRVELDPGVGQRQLAHGAAAVAVAFSEQHLAAEGRRAWRRRWWKRG